MRYVSTRGGAPEQGFEDVLLAGLARDGGLYCPVEWPHLSRDDIRDMAGMSYQEIAHRVIMPFVGEELGSDELRQMLDESYAGFKHKAIAPLVQMDANDWLLELFHGPTLAFKDFAMQLLARLMDRALERRKRRATIVGATSGDTGGAAIEAFRGRDNIDIFILHPHNRVSEVQRRQMTTASESNVHNIALEGNFDDCQALLKALFNDHALRDELQLAGVNSINWARILGQIPYYFSTAVALGAPERELAFCVPTGNFGDVFAGYAASRMGLPVARFVIASNANDILTRTLATGRYASQQALATLSPSMDIQVSSNFERMLFELSGHDSNWINARMADFAANGSFALGPEVHARLQLLFSAHRIDDQGTQETISRVFGETGYVVDPHTAVGLGAAQLCRDNAEVALHVPLVTLSTAHPAKFPDAVERATGHAPAQPAGIIAQSRLPERLSVLPNDFGRVAAHIRERVRVGRG